MLQQNALIHERYRIVRLIATGGFGAVYEAIDERLNQHVALKQLVRVSERIARQFTNEARLLANLNHPALPRVTDYFPDPDGPCLVMDYVPGDDLATLLYDRNAPFAVDEVLGLADKLLDVLQYLHTRQPPIIHRDIKPQNLKLRTDGSIILLDFGLAKGYTGEGLPTSGASSMMAFTRGFAPPEQVEGTGTEARSDLYALGATLYCLLTNTAPSEAQIRLLNVMRGKPDSLRPAHEYNPLVPPAISEVLGQAMALDMDERPADAAVLKAMLAAARAGIAPTPPRPATPQPTHGSSSTEIEASADVMEVVSNPSASLPVSDEVAAQYRQGVAAMTARQWAQALQHFEAVERQVPGYRDTRTLVAQARYEQARLKHLSLPAPNIAPPLAPSKPQGQPNDARRPGGQRVWLWAVLGVAAIGMAVLAFTVFARDGLDTPGIASNTTPTPTLVVGSIVAAGESSQPRIASATRTRVPTAIPPSATLLPTATPQATSTSVPTPTTAPSPTAEPTETSAPTPTELPTETPDPTSYAADAQLQALVVVQSFFDAINARDYNTAYSLLGSTFQRNQPYAAFEAGFGTTDHDEVEIVSIEQSGVDEYTVNVYLRAYQTDGSVQRFSGPYVVGREGGVWKIIRAKPQPE